MIINSYSNLQLNIQSNTSVTDNGNINVSDSKPMETGNQALDGLSLGTTVTGQIKGVDDNGNVIISLGENSLLYARLDTSVDLPVGSLISFLVKSHDLTGVTLSPLLTNMDTEGAVTKALSQAGLVFNERNAAMIDAMMKEGMSIGKMEVNQMARNLSDIDSSSIADAVTLAKLGIEPTQENVEQLRAYLGYEHQITGAVDEIMDLIPENINALLTDGNTDSAIALTRDLLDIFTGQGALEPLDLETGTLTGMNLSVTELLNNTDIIELTSLLDNIGVNNEFTQAVINGQVSVSELLAVIDDLVNEEALPRTEELQQETIPSSDIQETNNNIGQSFLSALSTVNENATIQNAIKDAENQISADKTANILNLIKSKPLHELIKTAVNDQWKLTPKQLEVDRQVSDLYRRMTEQTQRLIDVLNNHSKADSELGKEVSNLSKNLNFCNELNNMFEYVQLPMRLTGNDAHGELYVYSNKKHMASEDGSVSALLHLDMDHLGATDVYVTMNSSQHVNTHFYLPDDEALDLIAAHIDELNSRIEQRGYSLTAEFSKREELTNVMKTIVSDNKSVVPISVSGFDAKA